METYIKAEKDLHQMAALLSGLVNVASQNPTSYQKEQRRHSENRGGEYYLFEVFGLTLVLIRNADDGLIPERKDWPYYVVIECDGSSQEFLRALAGHLARLLSSSSELEVQVDDLSA